MGGEPRSQTANAPSIVASVSRAPPEDSTSSLSQRLSSLTPSPAQKEKRLRLCGSRRNHDAPTPCASASLRVPSPPPPQAELFLSERLRRLLRRRSGRRRRRRNRGQQRKGLRSFFPFFFFFFLVSRSQQHPSPTCSLTLTIPSSEPTPRQKQRVVVDRGDGSGLNQVPRDETRGRWTRRRWQKRESERTKGGTLFPCPRSTQLPSSLSLSKQKNSFPSTPSSARTRRRRTSTR